MITFGNMTSGCIGIYRKNKHRCRICGQWFELNERFGLVVVHGLKYKDEYITDMLHRCQNVENAFVHENCWSKVDGNYHEKVIQIYKNKRPAAATKRLDLIDEKVVNDFKTKIKNFTITKETRENIYFKRGKVRLKYDKLKNLYDITNRMSGLSMMIMRSMIEKEIGAW